MEFAKFDIERWIWDSMKRATSPPAVKTAERPLAPDSKSPELAKVASKVVDEYLDWPYQKR